MLPWSLDPVLDQLIPPSFSAYLRFVLILSSRQNTSCHCSFIYFCFLAKISYAFVISPVSRWLSSGTLRLVVFLERGRRFGGACCLRWWRRQTPPKHCSVDVRLHIYTQRRETLKCRVSLKRFLPTTDFENPRFFRFSRFVNRGV